MVVSNYTQCLLLYLVHHTSSRHPSSASSLKTPMAWLMASKQQHTTCNVVISVRQPTKDTVPTHLRGYTGTNPKLSSLCNTHFPCYNITFTKDIKILAFFCTFGEKNLFYSCKQTHTLEYRTFKQKALHNLP